MSVIPDRLTKLDTITLLSGSHGAGKQEFCFNEAAAWLAGEKHTDAPDCVSRYLRNYTMRLNDRWDDEKRQTLLPYLVRVIGTGGDGKDPIRQKIAAHALCHDLLPPWLRLAGLDNHAVKVEAAANLPYTQMIAVIRDARDAGWAKRNENRAILQARVREHLQARGSTTVAAAAAGAAAAAVAVAAADAVAVAVAVAAAAAVADGKSYYSQYNAAYAAARQYYHDNPLAVGQEIADLAARQNGAALALLDRLIVAEDPS